MKRLNNDMYACGRIGLPEMVFCEGRTWRHQRTFKHDFFACTGLYSNGDLGRQCVVKIGRLQRFLGVPTEWLGRFLRNRELKILQKLNGIDQVPHLLGTFGHTGLFYGYIEGQSLDEKPDLGDDFFEELGALLAKLHERDICYMDMNKRGNILAGEDGRPYLIDFQISLYLPGRFWAGLRQYFQRADRYHLLKHKRRLRPDLMSEDERQYSIRHGTLIELHRRFIANPFRAVRRAILRFLYKKHILTPHSDEMSTPENDHRRFLK